ncbi:MAG: 4Fe-4S dicluster domain-containing protein [Candidatus Delongbacteria bacterium]
MSELRPFPFAALLRRLRHELAAGGPVFELPRKAWHLPDPELDLSFSHAGRRAANPFGPAAGPHTQLAPNLVQGWLAGARVFELKTLQVLDRLQIARPCIHAPHYALNVEWSQELSLPESVCEYQKAAWLLEILQRTRAGGALSNAADLATVLDLSVGYSLDGIRSAAMSQALAGLRDPATGLAELAAELPAELRDWAGTPPAGALADCVTLSTFHGCPPDEIESIAAHLLDQGWSVIIKFNPTLCGLEDVRRILHDQLGYTRLEPDPAAFAQDLELDGAVALMGRLLGRARRLGLSLGAKFSNTFVLQRDADLFPPEAGAYMYLSGAPLHPLALRAAARYAGAFPDPLPLSFSAGLERGNAVETLRCGFAPLTLCTDLLRRGGQGRLSGLLADVQARLRADGARSLQEWLGPLGRPETPGAWAETRRRLERAADAAAGDARYHARSVMKPPRQRETVLERLDCINCDLCLPACPNGALFGWNLMPAPGEAPRRQIGVLADACNACSNCETWCPEQGAPWRVKERWHQDLASLRAAPVELDGFCVAEGVLTGRISGCWLTLTTAPAGDCLAWEGELPDAPETLLERFLQVRDSFLKGDNPAALLSGEGL